MQDYTHLSIRELKQRWAELIDLPMPPIRRSLIVKYLIWYEQAKREKISFLGFFNEIKQAVQTAGKGSFVLAPGSQITRSYKGGIYTVEAVPQGYLYKGKKYKSLSGIAKEITGKNWNGKVFFGVKDER